MNKWKIYSWNVNGIRACVKNKFMDWVHESPADVIALQEVRADQTQIPKELASKEHLFQYYYAATSKKGYSGVGILSPHKALEVRLGIGKEEFDREGRAITAFFDKVIVVSAYFPNSQDKGARIDYKIAYCEQMQRYLEEYRRDSRPLILTGDFNIAHERIDLARPDQNNESPGFLPQEREWMTHFLRDGWVDSFRHLHPEKIQYSWWSARSNARPRNIGWRIDYHTLPEKDRSKILAAGIEDQQMGSDHCPVGVEVAG